MSKVERIEEEVLSLSEPELARFREWYAEFDATAWDKQFEDDIGAGKLDSIADRSAQEHRPVLVGQSGFELPGARNRFG